MSDQAILQALAEMPHDQLAAFLSNHVKVNVVVNKTQVSTGWDNDIEQTSVVLVTFDQLEAIALKNELNKFRANEARVEVWVGGGMQHEF